MLQQMNAQVNTDNQRLMTQAETMVNAFKQTQASLNDLRKTPDPSTAPSSIQSTIRRLCEQRKAAGVPCVAPRPADKPIIE